ncbi:MAG TPA: MBL fold metallo-hydrolase [Fimbriimonadaceae bacterium]|nr:MBL fold metallo-hydrolase [Fimbriimonadaceae bacterium]
MHVSLKLGGLILGSGLVGGYLGWRDTDPTRLTFLSVGQGDCAVFQTDGYTVLIDVGPKNPYSDGGKKIVLPDLRKMGIDEIDLVLLSHPDMDHIGGLGALLKGMPVGRVALSADFAHFEPLLAHLREAGCAPAQTTWLGPGQRAQIGDFTLEVDCPEWRDGEPDNDGSEFVKIAGDGASAVFTGDADASTERRMMVGHDWSAQILKLGHHGSHTASCEAWLEAVHPQWGIVSCGRDNPYGHPHKDVLERAEKLGIEIARTDRDGDVSFVLGPHGWERRL